MGFALPLYGIISLETLLALILMLPDPLSEPAIFLFRQTKTQIGRTFLFTTALFLCVLLISPMYDAYTVHQQKKASVGMSDFAEADTGQAAAQLSACLNLAALFMMFLLRRLALVLDDRKIYKGRLPEDQIKLE